MIKEQPQQESRDHEGKFWQEISRPPFPKTPSCSFGHQRAPVFQRYYGKVTNVSSIFCSQHTPVKLTISVYVYKKLSSRVGGLIPISTLCPCLNRDRNHQPLCSAFLSAEMERLLHILLQGTARIRLGRSRERKAF